MLPTVATWPQRESCYADNVLPGLHPDCCFWSWAWVAAAYNQDCPLLQQGVMIQHLKKTMNLFPGVSMHAEALIGVIFVSLFHDSEMIQCNQEFEAIIICGRGMRVYKPPSTCMMLFKSFFLHFTGSYISWKLNWAKGAFSHCSS